MGNYSAEQRRQLLKQGKALPGDPPRFPIDNPSDVSDAINLAKTPAERAHVYKHAKRLGVVGRIPAHWRPDGSTRN